jgi:PAS domain-containing protein
MAGGRQRDAAPGEHRGAPRARRPRHHEHRDDRENSHTEPAHLDYGTPVPADHHPVEIIMARGLMSNLTTPAFLVDSQGTLVFFNDAASELLGVSFEEAGPMPADVWGTRFEPSGPDGKPVPVEELPLAIALTESRPAHGPLSIRSAGGDHWDIVVTCFPIVGHSGQSGALAIFWSESH